MLKFQAFQQIKFALSCLPNRIGGTGLIRRMAHNKIAVFCFSQPALHEGNVSFCSTLKIINTEQATVLGQAILFRQTGEGARTQSFNDPCFGIRNR